MCGSSNFQVKQDRIFSNSVDCMTIGIVVGDEHGKQRATVRAIGLFARGLLRLSSSNNSYKLGIRACQDEFVTRYSLAVFASKSPLRVKQTNGGASKKP